MTLPCPLLGGSHPPFKFVISSLEFLHNQLEKIKLLAIIVLTNIGRSSFSFPHGLTAHILINHVAINTVLTAALLLPLNPLCSMRSTQLGALPEMQLPGQRLEPLAILGLGADARSPLPG